MSVRRGRGNGERKSLRIGAILPVEYGYARGVLIGMAGYCTAARLSPVLVGMTGGFPIDLRAWDLDAVISMSSSQPLTAHIREAGLPLINVSARHEPTGVATVVPDNPAVGRAGAEHLLDRGFSHFAFAAFAEHWYSQQRQAGFAERLATEEIEPRILATPPDTGDFAGHQASLCEQLGQLPRPVGIMCCNDIRARHVLEACRKLGLRVPGDVGVVGVDDDETICLASDPPLSSVDVGARQVGGRAAELMHHHVCEGRPLPELELVPPRGVVVRASSAGPMPDDPLVAAALRIIHARACDPISVETLLDELCEVDQMPISRRSLERKFQETLGHPPAVEIRRVQLDRARRLLADTDLPMHEVAAAAGLGSERHLRILLRRELDITPGAYRRRFRSAHPGSTNEPDAD